MSSILTNNSAMIALQTLRGINKGLAQTQSEISTGKSIGSARDNAAIWSISKTMESDVKGFKAISDSLSLGSSTVGVARQAAETVTDLLTQMKGRIVAAQENNVDRSKIQADVEALTDQIKSVVGAAQFNGLNLTNGTQTVGTDARVDILSSLDRAADGTVQSANISVDLSETNLSTAAGTALTGIFPAGGTATEAAAAPVTLAATAFDFSIADGTAGGAVALRADELTGPAAGLVAGDQVGLDVGGVNVSYTIREGDGGAAVLGGLRGELEAAGLSGDIAIAFDGSTLTVTNNKPAGVPANDNDINVTLSATRGQGGLSPLETLNVAGDDAQRTNALRDIETMIQFSIDAAATFGSAQSRIDTQAEFISNLTDSLTSGIGSMVDADMEATSARLQALQVQQQLATQSLSIANQGPQNILALFR